MEIEYVIIYEHNHDTTDIKGIITEEYLDDYIEHYKEEFIKNHDVKFIKMMTTKTGTITYEWLCLGQEIDLSKFGGGIKTYPEFKEYSGFNYDIIKVNNFKDKNGNN